MSLYTIKGLIKSFGSRQVLDIDNLNIEKGRIYSLLGANGAGKTSLLNILAFLERPTAGEISYRSVPVKYQEPDLHRLRRQVIMLDQHPILFTTSVYKNLEFGLKIRKINRQERIKRINEALDLVGMADFANKPATTLSGGETQRVALARVLVLEPQVLLCDEPTSSVDAENELVIAELLKRLNKQLGMSIIFTTHDRSLASSLADKTINLDSDRLVGKESDNIFAGCLTTDSRGQVECLLDCGLQFLLGESISADLSGREAVLVRIDPSRISLTPKSGAVDNLVIGVVKNIGFENEKIRICLQGAADFYVNVSPEEYRLSKVFAGEKRNLYIPQDAIEVCEFKKACRI